MKIEDNRIFYVLLPIAAIAVIYAFGAASTLFLWIIASFFLFALIDPWMQKLTSKGANPILVAIALVIVAFALLSGMGFLVYKTSSGIISQLISYKAAIFKVYENATNYMTHWTQLFTHPHDAALLASNPEVQAPATAVAGAVPTTPSVTPNDVGLGVLSGLNSVISVLTFVVLTPLLTFFMVAERDLFGLVGANLLQHPARGKEIWKEITDAITAFFLGNLILILVSFPVFVLSFLALGVKSFLSLGLLSAILNLVPFLGFVLAAILPTLDLLMNGGHLGGAALLITICLITHFTIANVVTPKLLGAKLDLNATVSTIALIGWGELWGPMGLLLAIPITALIKILFQHSGVSSFQLLASLMSEDPRSLQKQGLAYVSQRLGGKSAASTAHKKS